MRNIQRITRFFLEYKRGSEVQERPATDVQAQFSGRIWNFTRIAFGQSAARARHKSNQPLRQTKSNTSTLMCVYMSLCVCVCVCFKGPEAVGCCVYNHQHPHWAPSEVSSSVFTLTYYILEATLSNHSSELAPFEFIRKKINKRRRKQTNTSRYKYWTLTESQVNQGVIWGNLSTRFGPKLLSAISTPVKTHLSHSSFLPSSLHSSPLKPPHPPQKKLQRKTQFVLRSTAFFQQHNITSYYITFPRVKPAKAK